MSERSIYSTILSAELARWHEEALNVYNVFNTFAIHSEEGIDWDQVDKAVDRLAGLLPDDIRPQGVKPTPFVQRSKKTEADDLL